MMATVSLPSNYSRYTILQPAKKPEFILGAIVTGSALLLSVGWLLVMFANALRPTALDGMRLHDLFRSTATGSSVAIPPGLFRTFGLAVITAAIVHELVHGLFYWLFSSHRPKFGWQGLFPYAAGPYGVYFPRNQFMLIGLSPLVLLTAVGLLLIATVPIAYVPLLFFFVAFNASGAAGDLILVMQLMAFPADTVMEDKGSGVMIYGPTEKANP